MTCVKKIYNNYRTKAETEELKLEAIEESKNIKREE
jgi:hypothetical protein